MKSNCRQRRRPWLLPFSFRALILSTFLAIVRMQITTVAPTASNVVRTPIWDYGSNRCKYTVTSMDFTYIDATTWYPLLAGKSHDYEMAVNDGKMSCISLNPIPFISHGGTKDEIQNNMIYFTG